MAKKSKTKPTAIDLFCGCGGLSLGLRKAGFSVVAGVDADALASSTYRMNHKSALVVEEDIGRVDPKELMAELDLSPGDLGLLAGCPPCQGFSTLRTLNGGRDIDDPMNDLIFQFSRFISCFRPKTIMIENVPGLASDPRLVSFSKSIAAMGYKYRFQVFDAADYGVPQRRRRMILLAALAERPEFSDASRKRPTVRDAIEFLPPPGRGEDPAHDYPVTRAPHVEALIRRVPKDGGSRTSLGASDQLPCHQKCDGFKDVYGRIKTRGRLMQMLRAKCAKGCGDFDVVSIPMPAREACKAMLARNVCPFCGATTGHLVADPRPLTESEIVQKKNALARQGRGSSANTKS